MSEEKSLREQVVENGVAAGESALAVQKAYDALQAAVDALPERLALVEAVQAREKVMDRLAELSLKADQNMSIAEQFEAANEVAERMNVPKLSFDDAFAMLTPEEKVRYRDEEAALGAALEA